MDEKIYDDIYFTLVTNPTAAPDDLAAEIIRSLAAKYFLPVALEHGVHFMGIDSETGQPAEGYLLAESLQEAFDISRTLNTNYRSGTSGARPEVRAVCVWHPAPPTDEVANSA